LRFKRQWTAGRKVVLAASKACIMGGKEAGRSVAVVQLTEHRRGRENVVVRIKGIGAKSVA
jgi:hypothetical protein